MAVKTNMATLNFAVEESLGTLPGSISWYEVDRTGISSFGSSVVKEEVVPINKKAMNQKSIVTGYDSSLGYSNNLTISALKAHIQGAMRSTIQAQEEVVPTAVVASSDSFTHAAIDSALAENTLVYARNFTNSDNNGLHVVDALSTTTSTITTSSLVDESSIPTSARFNVVGVQGTSGDIGIDSDGNLTSSTLDFTSLGLSVGQPLWVGGGTTGTKFATSEYTGLVRIKVIAANLLTIGDHPWTVSTSDDGTGKTIQLFFGDFIKNVYRTDSDYNAESYTFEGVFPGMDDGTNYEYPNGNRVDTCSLSFDTRSRATVEWSFIGKDTPDISTTRKSGTWYNLYDNKAFGTSSDCVFIKVKDSSLVDFDSTFTNFSIDIANSINPRDALCTAAHVDLNDGNFTVSGTINSFLNDSDMINAIKNNENVTISYAIQNDDGVIDFYIPSVTLDDKTYDMADNDNVIVNSTYMAFEDSFYNMIMGIGFFHYLPN